MEFYPPDYVEWLKFVDNFYVDKLSLLKGCFCVKSYFKDGVDGSELVLLGRK